MKYYLSIIALFMSFLIQAQFGLQSTGQEEIINPVKWSGSVTETGENQYKLVFDAEIENDWHVYSQHTPDGGPLALEITYKGVEEGEYILEGETQESKTETGFSDIFGVDEIYFSKKAKLTQNITLKNTSLNVVKTELFYQVCKEVCINQTFYIAFNLDTKKAKVFENFDEFEAYGVKKDTPKKENDTKQVKEKEKKKEGRSFLGIFIASFLFGFTALLTPCVFPMIPMTVSFFTKQSKNKAKGIKNAIIYGVSIIVIYVLLGTIVTAIFGADSLNALSTNVWFNVIFFLLLVVFAASFLGAFEIMLPNSWVNKVDKQADKGGIIGIFFMALALAIVSFSCTGPIVGTLLVEAASKGGIAPIIGMLGFSSAIAIPFALFAMFPGWLNSLPRSGGWLNSVKVVLGFLELALAFKFLSNADLVLQAHWLEREVFLAIWIAVFGTLAMYLFGKIRLPHDSPVQSISVGRLGFGLLVLTFTIYLIPGLWGAPLKLISGFPPPMSYSESPYGVGYTKGGVAGEISDFPEGASLGPHDIIAFKDYETGVAYAKKVNKPIFLDFTGMACVNCRKMEERVWSDPKILSILKSDIVLISLYVDVKEKLPKAERYTSETTGKRIRTIGNKWSDFQIKHYGANAQPYYVLLDHDEEKLNAPIGYTPDIEEYKTWLKEGIANFKK